VERWNISVEASDQPVSQLVKYIGLTDNSSESGEVVDVVGGSGRKESHLTGHGTKSLCTMVNTGA